MINILFVAPISGNGGIQSWCKNFLKLFNVNDIFIDHINVSQRRSSYTGWNICKRSIDGILDLLSIRSSVKRVISINQYDVFYTTSSGSLGSFRDWVLGIIAKKNNLNTILHCHYGCLESNYRKGGLIGWLLKKSLRYYDQIWVLDSQTLSFLNSISDYKDKVFLTPNFIDVPASCNTVPSDFKKIAFVGNLLKEKGVIDLIHAVKESPCPVTLDIIGPGTDAMISEVISAIGDDINNKIRLLGPLPNNETIKFMKSIDIIALPTYYHSEAFPISILEAMSLGKMIITTKRAAIPDMLIDIEGNDCACFVREHSVSNIIDAFIWCQNNNEAAISKCLKAYEKVKSCYDVEVVMNIYKTLFYKFKK